MGHVKVTFNDEAPVVVAAVAHPAAPASYIDLNATVAAAFRARDLRDPTASEEDVKSFRVTVEEFVVDAEDYPKQSSDPNVGVNFGNVPEVVVTNDEDE